MRDAFFQLNKKEQKIIIGLGLAGLVLNPWSIPIFLVCLWTWLKYPGIKWYYYLLPVLGLVLLTMVVMVLSGMLSPVQVLTTPGVYLTSYFIWFYKLQFFVQSLADLDLSIYFGRFIDMDEIVINLFVALQGMLTYWALAVLFINYMRERGGYKWWVSGN